jgi:hypothetical protein
MTSILTVPMLCTRLPAAQLPPGSSPDLAAAPIRKAL